MTSPTWLPPTVCLNGAWNDVVAVLYNIFDRDFRQANPQFRGVPIKWDQKVNPGERYEEGFWHLISRDDRTSGDRLPDFRRAERLPWCRPVIDHESESEVFAWDFVEGNGKKRTYLWLAAFDYVVILERRSKLQGNIMFLVTAFHVDGDGRRRQLRAKYNSKVA